VAFNDAVLNGLARRAERLTGGEPTAGDTMTGLRTCATRPARGRRAAD
jgi:hypothetical protein